MNNNVRGMRAAIQVWLGVIVGGFLGGFNFLLVTLRLPDYYFESLEPGEPYNPVGLDYWECFIISVMIGSSLGLSLSVARNLSRYVAMFISTSSGLLALFLYHDFRNGHFIYFMLTVPLLSGCMAVLFIGVLILVTQWE